MSLDGLRVLIVESTSSLASHWSHALQEAGARVDVQERAGKGLEALLLGAVTPQPHRVVLLGPSVGESMQSAFRHTLVGALAACRLATLHTRPHPSPGPTRTPSGATFSAGSAGAAVRVVRSAMGLSDTDEVEGVALPSPPERLRVLLVEDNPINQEVAEAALQHAGMSVRSVFDGQQALAAVQSERFDAAVMDIQMPVMDGIAATRAIRQLPGPTGALPIVAMTANVLPNHRAAAAAAGMNDFVEKPIRPAVLIEAILSAIRGESRFAADPSGRQAEPEAVPLDLTVLSDLKNTFGPALVRVQSTLARDAPRRRQRMLDAARTRDFPALRREAHSLKSSSGTFGLRRLSGLCSVIEAACVAERYAEALTALERLDRVLDDDLQRLADQMG